MYIRQKEREREGERHWQKRESLFFKLPFLTTRTVTKTFPSVIIWKKRVKCMQGQQNYLPYPILGLKEKWDFAFELSFTRRRAEQVI